MPELMLFRIVSLNNPKEKNMLQLLYYFKRLPVYLVPVIVLSAFIWTCTVIVMFFISML